MKTNIFSYASKIHSNQNKTFIHVPPKILSSTTNGIPMTWKNNGLAYQWQTGSLKSGYWPYENFMANWSIWPREPDRTSSGQRLFLNHGPLCRSPLWTQSKDRVENAEVQKPSKGREKQNGPKKLIPNQWVSSSQKWHLNEQHTESVGMDKDFNWEAKVNKYIRSLKFTYSVPCILKWPDESLKYFLKDFIKDYLVIVSWFLLKQVLQIK